METGRNLDTETVRARKLDLVRTYANPVRLLLAYKLLMHHPRNLTADIIDEHAKEVMLNIIRRVRVVPWPPSKDTDDQVEQILTEYLSSLPKSTGAAVSDVERGQLEERASELVQEIEARIAAGSEKLLDWNEVEAELDDIPTGDTPL